MGSRRPRSIPGESARELLEAYDLGTFQHLEPMPAQGLANANYRLVTSRGTYLYRLCLEQPAHRCRGELRVLEILRAHEFPAAYPVADRQGESLRVTREGPVILYEYIEGKHPARTPASARAVGEVLADLHRIPVPDGMEIRNSITHEDCEQMAREFESRPESPEDLVLAYAREVAELKGVTGRPLPRGFIHADVFPDNVLFEGDRLVAIIDFEEVCTDACLLDLGAAAQGFAFDGDELDRERLESLVEGYRSRRSWSEEEARLWPSMLRFGAILIGSWHLRHWLAGTGRGSLERLAELVERSRTARA